MTSRATCECQTCNRQWIADGAYPGYIRAIWAITVLFWVIITLVEIASIFMGGMGAMKYAFFSPPIISPHDLPAEQLIWGIIGYLIWQVIKLTILFSIRLFLELCLVLFRALEAIPKIEKSLTK